MTHHESSICLQNLVDRKDPTCDFLVLLNDKVSKQLLTKWLAKTADWRCQWTDIWVEFKETVYIRSISVDRRHIRTSVHSLYFLFLFLNKSTLPKCFLKYLKIKTNPTTGFVRDWNTSIIIETETHCSRHCRSMLTTWRREQGDSGLLTLWTGLDLE